MGDDDDRPAARHGGQVLLNDGLAFGVERARRLVEHQHRRIVDQCPRDRQPLALAARQVRRTLFQHRRVAVRQPLDEFVGAGELGGAHDIVQRRGRLGHRDIFAHRAAEQKILLQHHADLGAQMSEIELLQILPVDAHQPGLWPIQPLDQPGDRRLARAAAADDADDLAGLDREGHVLDRRRRRIRIVEGDVGEFDAATDRECEFAARRLGRRLHQLSQQFQRQHRPLIVLHQARGVD